MFTLSSVLKGKELLYTLFSNLTYVSECTEVLLGHIGEIDDLAESHVDDRVGNAQSYDFVALYKIDTSYKTKKNTA